MLMPDVIKLPDQMPTIAANFESRCLICDEQIYEGDPITLCEGEWCHAECVAEELGYGNPNER